MKTITTVETMTLDGGTACLDFINSGYDREHGVVVERLHSYEDLLVLAGRIDLLEPAILKTLHRQVSKSPALANKALAFARQARVLLYQLFTGETDMLPEVNTLFADALRYRVLKKGDAGLSFTADVLPAGLPAPVWLLVLDAYLLIERGEFPLVRQCPRCSWLFVDRSKSHRRKWCSMESCGNSQKTKSYYQRKKATSGDE
ncbi:CGNR zinc finger domain-containing protein [Deminuibacter soli]|uniref:Zinc finger CGNR domain-containing protein n=1 Tax=Deminuibacter soli TaxID=2291815 RepID=A0A3E1NG71_9BACT|nr:CGNR zinc finger domain-containing protein [Deminuibacter soli]RFM26821.1 hypothetical protein DXN05_17690 [Deminuibacter soli]